MNRLFKSWRLVSAIIAVATLAMAVGNRTISAAEVPRRTATLVSSSQFIGLQTTSNSKGFRLTAAVSPTTSGISASGRSAATLVVGPAAFAPPTTVTTTSNAEIWAAY